MKKIIAIAILVVCSYQETKSQDSIKNNRLTMSGYMELYYLKDFNNPISHTRPSFVYSYNRTGEITINLGFIKAAYSTANVRANLSLAAGTYMNANLATEPGVLKNLYEANAGVKLSRSAALWLDAGIMPSHIGFESAVGKDCWNLTRSMLADNSPYYETGARLSYTSPDNRWYLAGLVLNGWQRIQRIDGNTTPAFGTQVTFKPNNAITLNSSSFIGNDKPDSVRQMRYFHNFYGIFQLNKFLAVTAGFDIGWEQKSKGSSNMYHWYSPVLILKCNTSAKTALAVRGEYYTDPDGVIIATGTPNGFRTWGFSANFDLAISPDALWRIEARALNSKDKIFTKAENMVNGSTTISTALAINF